MPEWEKTGNVSFKGLTDSISDTPKQTEVRNTTTGETRKVDGNCGDDDDDLGKHIQDGDWVEEE